MKGNMNANLIYGNKHDSNLYEEPWMQERMRQEERSCNIQAQMLLQNCSPNLQHNNTKNSNNENEKERSPFKGKWTIEIKKQKSKAMIKRQKPTT